MQSLARRSRSATSPAHVESSGLWGGRPVGRLGGGGEGILAVEVDGRSLAAGDWIATPGANWLSLSAAAIGDGAVVTVRYQVARDVDVAIAAREGIQLFYRHER